MDSLEAIYYFRKLLSPPCQSGSPCRSKLVTTEPSCQAMQLSERIVFQWMPKGRVETRACKVQGQEDEDKQGSFTALGGCWAMKSLENFMKRFSCLGNFENMKGFVATWDSEDYSGLLVSPWALLRTHKAEASVYLQHQTT